LDRKHRGAQSELIASAWLLEQGYEVFRNVSANGIVDIVAYNMANGDFVLVDVKTGTSAQHTKEQPIHGVRFLGVTIADNGMPHCRWIDNSTEKNPPLDQRVRHMDEVKKRKDIARFKDIWQ
jgi:hypothetical protein